MNPNMSSIAFKVGMEDAYYIGCFNYAYRDSLSSSEAYNYKCGYDRGLTLYAEDNELDGET
jgi:hypothetical protein